MVAWNPDVPNPSDNTPKWGGNSQPITRWEGDSSLGRLFEGVGNTLEVAAKGADYLVKHNIDEEAWNRINPEREAYTQTLEAGYKTAGGKVEQPLNITQPGAPPAPQAIERSLKYVQSVTAGVEAGKVNDTFYKGVLVNIAKDLRAQYPGYREYIDNKISSITGFDPANAKVNELLTDINSLSTKKDTDKEHLLTDLRKNIELPGASKIIEEVRAGQRDVNSAYRWLEEKLAPEYNNKVIQRAVADVKGRNELDQDTMRKGFDSIASLKVKNALESFEDAIGLKTNPQLMEKVRLHNLGVKRMDSTELDAIASVLTQRKQDVRAILEAEATKENQHGQSTVKVMGIKYVNETIDAHLDRMEKQIKHVSSGDLSAAMSITREVKARQNDAVKQLLDDKKFGPVALRLGATREVMGEGILAKFAETQLLPKIGPDLTAYVTKFGQAAAAQGEQPNPYGPLSLKEEVQKVNNLRDKLPAATTADALVKYASGIITSDPQSGITESQKRGMLQAIIERPGVVGQFSRDGVNPDGTWKKGQSSVYNQLTSPLFTKEARRITQNDPELWNRYTSWAKNEWGTEIFNKDIRELSSVTLPAGARIGWNTEEKRFTLEYKGKDVLLEKSVPLAAGGERFRGYEVGDRTLVNLAPVMNKINMGLFNIKNIAEAEGKRGNELDAYVMRFLVDAGMRPLDPNATSIPQHMLNVLYGPSLREIMQKKNSANELQ